MVAGVAITHPQRVLYPEAGLRKLDIVRYYERIAPVMLPYIRNRPLALVRCPSGPASHCFFQKHAEVGDIPGIETVQIEESRGVLPYVIANSVRALVGLAQMNVIELHSWGARSDRVEQPDTLVLDLDPWTSITSRTERDGLCHCFSPPFSGVLRFFGGVPYASIRGQMTPGVALVSR